MLWNMKQFYYHSNCHLVSAKSQQKSPSSTYNKISKYDFRIIKLQVPNMSKALKETLNLAKNRNFYSNYFVFWERLYEHCLSEILNGSQLAKVKKCDPYMSLPLKI